MIIAKTLLPFPCVASIVAHIYNLFHTNNFQNSTPRLFVNALLSIEAYYLFPCTENNNGRNGNEEEEEEEMYICPSRLGQHH
jgi:hypothetical protein